MVPLRPPTFSKRDTPDQGRLEEYSTGDRKITRSIGCKVIEQVSMKLVFDSIQSMEQPLCKSKKVKRGATWDEADIDDTWLTALRTFRRCRDDKNLGISCYPYEIAPGASPFAGGYFMHREWAIRLGMKRHTSFRPFYQYKANHSNSARY
jgi:hypothetical protein